MTREQLAQMFADTFKELIELRSAGQKEYAHDINDAFANFSRVGKYLNQPKEKVLLTYALKHLDGITAYVNGHESQREDVTGRIHDLIVYLLILKGMIVEERQEAFVIGKDAVTLGPATIARR